MDSDTLNYIRTSLKKSPQEWIFEEELISSGRVKSFLNIFHHIPTNFVLILIHIPKFELPEYGEYEESYFIDIMSHKDYMFHVYENEGVFSPIEKDLQPINEKSIIVKTLNFIKQVTLEDEKILKYETFKSYVNDKYSQEEVNNRGDN